MPLEKTDNEWRARIRMPDEFDWIKQLWPKKQGNSHYPYNSKGIRSLGGKLKKEDKIVEQSIRFSTKTKYKWTEAKIRKWIKDHGHTLKELVKIKAGNIYDFYEKETEQKFKLITAMTDIITKDYKKGKSLIIEGIVNSSAIDAHNEIVDPKAVMDSKDFYMEFPTVRYMHFPDPIGKTLDLWREGDLVKARMEIDADETRIIQKILKGTAKAFSIGFLVLKWERFCPTKDNCLIRFTKIRLAEISVVDSPANRDAKIEQAHWKNILNIGDYFIQNSTNGKITLEKYELPEEDNTGLPWHGTADVTAKIDWDNEIPTTPIIQKKLEEMTNKKLTVKKSHLTLIDKSRLDSVVKKVNTMAEDDVENLDESQEGEEIEAEKPKEEQPTDSSTEVDSETTPESEDGEQKVLKAIELLVEKVDKIDGDVKALKTESERMKLSDEERKRAEELDEKIAEETKSLKEQLNEQEKKVQELQHEIDVKAAVQKALDNEPAKKNSLSSEQQMTEEDADEEAFKTLKHYV